MLRSVPRIRSSLRIAASPASSVPMAAPELRLPDATCVHCGARFNTAHLEYGLRTSLLPAEVGSRVLPLHRDEEATAFLQRCGAKGTAARLAQSAAAAALRTTLSLTDANALVGRGSMHVLSTAQARLLLGRSEGGAGVLLDVGAGDGGVTARLAPLFESVVATEASAPMVRRLQERNFALSLHTLEVEAAGLRSASPATLPDSVDRALSEGFDCVALLNVLDRCDAPRTLLAQLRRLLRPDTGRLLLAVVLPFRPFVEEGTLRRAPAETLGLPPNGGFEESLAQLYATVLQPLGLRLEAVSRAPYLSDGDQACPVYCLDDALLVLSAAELE